MDVSHIRGEQLNKFGELNSQFDAFFKDNAFEKAWALSEEINQLSDRICRPAFYSHPQNLSFDNSASVGAYFTKPDEQYLPRWKQASFFSFMVIECSHEALLQIPLHPEINLNYNNSRRCSWSDIHNGTYVEHYEKAYHFFKNNLLNVENKNNTPTNDTQYHGLLSVEQQKQLMTNFIHGSMIHGVQEVFFDAFNTEENNQFYLSRLIQRTPNIEQFLNRILQDRPQFFNDRQYDEALYLYVLFNITPQTIREDFQIVEPLIYQALEKDFMSYRPGIIAAMLFQFDTFKPYVELAFDFLEQQDKFEEISLIGKAFLHEQLLSRHVIHKGLFSPNTTHFKTYEHIEQATSFFGNMSNASFNAFIKHGEYLKNNSNNSDSHINNSNTNTNTNTNQAINEFNQKKLYFIQKISQYKKLCHSTGSIIHTNLDLNDSNTNIEHNNNLNQSSSRFKI